MVLSNLCVPTLAHVLGKMLKPFLVAVMGMACLQAMLLTRTDKWKKVWEALVWVVLNWKLRWEDHVKFAHRQEITSVDPAKQCSLLFLWLVLRGRLRSATSMCNSVTWFFFRIVLMFMILVHTQTYFSIICVKEKQSSSPFCSQW